MYPIVVHSLMHRSLRGMNADDPTVPYTPSRARRLELALRSRRTPAARPTAPVVALAPSAPEWERTAECERRCA